MRAHTAVRRLTGAVAKENPVPLLRNRVFYSVCLVTKMFVCEALCFESANISICNTKRAKLSLTITD